MTPLGMMSHTALSLHRLVFWFSIVETRLYMTSREGTVSNQKVISKRLTRQMEEYKRGRRKHDCYRDNSAKLTISKCCGSQYCSVFLLLLCPLRISALVFEDNYSFFTKG
jgi:hypothetical protein